MTRRMRRTEWHLFQTCRYQQALLRVRQACSDSRPIYTRVRVAHRVQSSLLLYEISAQQLIPRRTLMAQLTHIVHFLGAFIPGNIFNATAKICIALC